MCRICRERKLSVKRYRPWLLSFCALLAAAVCPAQPAKLASLALPVTQKAAGAAAGAPADSSLPDDVIHTAISFLGTPYVHGGGTREGFDCSGLIFTLFRQTAAIELPRSVGSLYRSGAEVLRPLHLGDLVFFDTDDNGAPTVPTHVGLYIGADRFVHAASEGPNTGVIISSLQLPYYKERFLGARRVITWRPPVLSMKLTDDFQALKSASPFPSHESMKICILNGMSGGGPMDLSLFKDGEEVLSRRIVPGGQAPAELLLTPDVGQWTVRVARIFKGRELQNLTFRVEE
jgi:hypothetical protein